MSMMSEPAGRRSAAGMRGMDALIAFSRVMLAVCCFAPSLGAQGPALASAPGRMIDVGGRRLHLLCSGQGSPTIVLEAGASSFAIDWTLVQRELDRTNRVCSYDRAGLGWSDSSATRGNESHDLHRLLGSAGERPPYILVGASRGGLLARAYVAEYPVEVAGLVLVDPSSEDRLFTMLGGEGVLIASLTAEQLQTTFPRRPVHAPRRPPQTGAPFDRLPPDLYRQRIILDERLIASIPETLPPEFIATAQERERAMLARLLAARSVTPHPLGDRPTVVLSRGDERNGEREAVHAALASLSTNSRHSVIAGAGHEIHLFDPGSVIRAARDVALAIRSKAKLPQ
jgi:pimeloyl-ACP methyl ester carboxylesterase